MTHRRDCECVRCDAGFRPTEQERAVARARWEVRRAEAAAQRALARRRERARLKQAAMALELGAEARAVDDQLRALREARERVDRDDKLALLASLRRDGLSLADALAEVERREAERAAS